MNRITVSKEKLLNTLKENLEIHKKDFIEAVQGYRVSVLEALATTIKTMDETTEVEDILNVKVDRINLSKPVSYQKEYENVIGMLEYCEDETIQLDEHEYKNYVQNEWSWSHSFSQMSNFYKTKIQ